MKDKKPLINFQKYKDKYEERAGIIECEGGKSKVDAEKAAMIQTKWDYSDDNNLDFKDTETRNQLIRLERQLLLDD
jgi:hypothetical protein